MEGYTLKWPSTVLLSPSRKISYVDISTSCLYICMQLLCVIGVLDNLLEKASTYWYARMYFQYVFPEGMPSMS